MGKIISVIMFLVIIIIFIVLSFNERTINTKTKKKILLFSIVVISIVGSYRSIGLDLENYREIFNNTNVVIDIHYFKTMFSYEYEPGFILLISLVKSVGLGFKSFLFVSLIIPLFIVYFVIVNSQKDIQIAAFALFLIMYLFSTDIIRHFIAAIIYLSALYSLSNNKKMMFYIKSIISVFAHYSNFIILLIRPFLSIKWNLSKYIITTIAVCVITFALKDVLINFITSQSYSNIIFIKFKNYLLYYDNRYEYLSGLHVILKFLLQYTIVFFHFIIILLVLNNNDIIRNKFYGLLLNSQIMGTMLLLILNIFNAGQMGLRINFLLSIGSFLLTKEVLFNKRLKKKSILYTFFMIYFGFYILIRVLYELGVHNPTSGYYIGF